MAPVAKGTGIVDDTKGRGRHFLRNVQSNKAGRGEKISISIVSWVNLNSGGTVGRDEHDVAGVRLYDHVHLLAVPVLAGSAAYAIGESRKWPTGLARQPLQAKAFYATLAVATLVGVALNFTSFNPIQALFWSAVINGVVAVPVMVLMMLLTANTKVMGQFTVTGVLRFTGWLTTAVMAAAVVGMLITAAI